MAGAGTDGYARTMKDTWPDRDARLFLRRGCNFQGGHTTRAGTPTCQRQANTVLLREQANQRTDRKSLAGRQPKFQIQRQRSLDQPFVELLDRILALLVQRVVKIQFRHPFMATRAGIEQTAISTRVRVVPPACIGPVIATN